MSATEDVMAADEHAGCATGCRIHLNSGALFDLDNPDPALINLRDAAKTLSRICRWGGRIRDDAEFISVAQHQVYTADVAAQWGATDATKLACLWHDGGEWLMYDWPRPIKRKFPEIAAMEHPLTAMIFAELGLGPHDYDADLVKRADNAACKAEARIVCLGSSSWDWGDTPDVEIKFEDVDDCRLPREAFEMFWNKHFLLTL
jgi:hypothetical protein